LRAFFTKFLLLPHLRISEREREKEECKVVITLIIVYIEMKHTRRYRL